MHIGPYHTNLLSSCLHGHLFILNCLSVAAPLQRQDCERVEESVPSLEEGGEEEAHPAGDLPERLQDSGEQVEERTEEEMPSGTSPPQVLPKPLPQLSTGDGEHVILLYCFITHNNIKVVI